MKKVWTLQHMMYQKTHFSLTSPSICTAEIGFSVSKTAAIFQGYILFQRIVRYTNLTRALGERIAKRGRFN